MTFLQVTRLHCTHQWNVWNNHCSGQLVSATDLQVRLGGILATDPDPDAVYANVSRVIPHPDYRDDVLHNDIGLLRLTSPVEYTDTIRPICLPPSNVNLDQFKVCVDTGFGRTSFGGLCHSLFLALYFILYKILLACSNVSKLFECKRNLQ